MSRKIESDRMRNLLPPMRNGESNEWLRSCETLSEQEKVMRSVLSADEGSWPLKESDNRDFRRRKEKVKRIHRLK